MCKFLTEWDYSDRWAVPHQLLPFTLTLYGFKWEHVLLFVYIWETFEVTLMYCFEWIEKETIQDSIINDPIQGLIGILVASMFLRVDKQFEVASWNSLWKNLLALIPLALPSLTMLNQAAEHDVHWGYGPCLVLMIVITWYFFGTRRWVWVEGRVVFVLTSMYILTLSFIVFGFIHDNSFWLATIVGFVYLCIAFLVGYRRGNVFLYLPL